MATSSFGKIDAYDESQETWEHYVERLGQYFVANDVPEDGEASKKRRVILLSVCGSKVYKLMSDLLVPTKPADKSYVELTQLIKDHYSPKPSEIVQRYKFHSRFREQGETVAQYVAQLRHLAEHCNFGDTLDTMIRDRLVCGINDDRIQRRLLSEKDIDYKKAYELSVSLETAAKNVKDIQNPKNPTQEVHKVSINKSKAHPQRGSNRSCFRCGGNPNPFKCKFKDRDCFICKEIGHIAEKCPHNNKPQNNYSADKPAQFRKFSNSKSKKIQHQGARPKTKHVHAIDEELDDDETLYSMYSLGGSNPYKLDMRLNDTCVTMEIDTGASRTVISETTFEKLPNTPQLTKSKVKLRSYSGNTIPVLGECKVKVESAESVKHLPILVVPGESPSLLGRDWMGEIRLNWKDIFRVSETDKSHDDPRLEKILSEHSIVFDESLGTVKGTKAKIHVEPDTKPMYWKPRPVPYALRDKIDQELERLTKEGTIQPVEFSEWATPIVPIVKPDGNIRICGDYKVTVNRCSKLDNYPIPKVEDMYASLGKCEEFTKLDLRHAYQQLELDEDSKKYTTINTHKGLFEYNRLPYGISSAPGIFQRTIENVLQNIPHVIVRIDDILLTGKTRKQHLDTLNEVLNRLESAGIRLKKDKCIFLAEEVIYLGHRVNKHGIQPVREKVRAIQDAPAPTNVKELQSFLGMINYYACYMPSLSSVLSPLYELLTKDSTWKWRNAQRKAFESAKQLLQSSNVLVHYDPEKEIVLACDASPYGLGAVISHIVDGYEHPIAFASRTLSPAEKNYSQIDKEGAAVVFGIKKFHQYLYGVPFNVYTDHKPLVGLFKSDKAVPTMASPRIQRWALFLSGYRCNIVYREGKNNANADGLSRLPLSETTTNEHTPGETLLLINLLETSLVSADQIEQWTTQDEVLSYVLENIRTGQTEKLRNKPELRPFYARRVELSTHNNCVMWGNRIVVPKQGHENLLDLLHEGHPGMVRMKQLARSYFWWPNLDSDIEAKVKNCIDCQMQSPVPATAPLHPWEWPDKPWSRLHIDYAGPFMGKMFLIVVDAYSKWLEVVPTHSSTSEVTIEHLRTMFAVHGLPDMIVSDNGSCFTSEEFKVFVKANGIQHVTTAPKHPSSNGLAERYVRIFKEGMRKMEKSGGTLKSLLSRFLLSYRSTPQATTGLSPAELLCSRKLKTKLDFVHPNVKNRVEEQQSKQKKYHDNQMKERTFEEGDNVFVKNFYGNPKWYFGEIEQQTGPVSYRVILQNGNVVRRHVDQIRKRHCENVELNDDSNSIPFENVDIPLRVDIPNLFTDSMSSIPGNVQVDTSNVNISNDKSATVDAGRESVENDSVASSRPQRQSKQPSYLNDYILQ